MDKFTVPIISISTDASYHPDHKVGAYAYYIICNHFKIQVVGVFKKDLCRDSNEAELLSISYALSTLLEKDYVPYSLELKLNTDSLNAIEEIIKQNTNIGKSVNKLWQNVIKRTRSRKYELMHIPSHSHSENPEAYANQWCDGEAKQLMRTLIPEGKIVQI